jgi:hypothetical protein
MVLLATNPFEQSASKEWQQTSVILNAQTGLLSGTPATPYNGNRDYYCYQLYYLGIGNPAPELETAMHCEETE